MFDVLIERLHQDFQFNKSSDFIQVELVGVYSVKLVRAQMEGNTQAAESLDRMIRCHMKDLKTTKVAREGEEPKGPRTSPSEWAAALIEKVSEVAEKKPAKKTARKKPKKSSDNTSAAKSRPRKHRQLRRVRMSESARNSLFQEILIENNFSSAPVPTREGAAIAAPGQWGLGRAIAVRELLPGDRPQGGCRSGWSRCPCALKRAGQAAGRWWRCIAGSQRCAEGRAASGACRCRPASSSEQSDWRSVAGKGGCRGWTKRAPRHRRAKASAFNQVATQQPAQVGLYELDLLNVALGPHPEMLGIQVDVFDVQGGQLTQPDPGTQQYLDHHPVAKRGRAGVALERLEQTPFFRSGQEPGRFALETVQPDRSRRVVRGDALPGRPGKKRPRRCLHAVQRCGRAQATGDGQHLGRDEHPLQQRGCDLPPGEAGGLALGHAGDKRKVPAVCGNGSRRPIFNRQAGAEGLEDGGYA